MRAIGAPTGWPSPSPTSEAASRYQTLASAKGIGFRFTEQSRMVLPASPGAALRYAVGGP